MIWDSARGTVRRSLISPKPRFYFERPRHSNLYADNWILLIRSTQGRHHDHSLSNSRTMSPISPRQSLNGDPFALKHFKRFSPNPVAANAARHAARIVNSAEVMVQDDALLGPLWSGFQAEEVS
jgi:hypothetical protein